MSKREDGDPKLPLVQAEVIDEDEPRLKVVVLRGIPVILDAVVAEAFGVETREVNQAVARNQEKFSPAHTFEVTEPERDFLRSQGVIPKPGRGGSRALPHVFSQKGVARLATILSTRQALEATDLIIDIFIDVYQQVERGRTDVTIAQSARLMVDDGAAKQNANLRQKLSKALEDLLEIEINRKKKTTVGDELGEVAGDSLDFVKAHLNAKGLENQRVAAETLHILVQARALRDRTRAELEKSAAETERVTLDNLDKKLAILERIQRMLERMEPSALVSLSHTFLRPPLLIQGPPQGHASNEDEPG